ARHAHRTELCAHLGLRRNETGDTAWMGKPQQAVQARCGFLQSFATDAQAFRIWDAEAVGGPGEGAFFAFERLTSHHCNHNHQTRRSTAVQTFDRAWRQAGAVYRRHARNPGFFNRLLGGRMPRNWWQCPEGCNKANASLLSAPVCETV